MNWSLEQLFPICPKPDCPKFRTRHMLPHQREIATQILTGNENYIYWQGGVGSAKTLLWGALAAAYLIMIPGSDIILCRKDYNLLYDTLWAYFKQSLQAAIDQQIIPDNFTKIFSKKTQGDHSICQLSNGSRARAVQLKQLNEAMGPNRDAIFISDAMENENFGFIFHGEGTVGGLQSRLRRQTSTYFYLGKDDLGNSIYKDMRRFLIESNPPPNINELHSIFGSTPGVRNLTNVPDPVTNKHITYRFIETSNIHNDHNPPSYRTELASQHSDVNDLKRILEGQSVPYYGGIKVIPQFRVEHHVNEFTVDESLPLLVSIDPGQQHPGVVVGQIRTCDYGFNHCIALSEVSNLYDKTTYELADYALAELLGILPHLALFYPSFFNYKEYSRLRDRLISLDGKDNIDYIRLEPFFEKIQFCMDRASEKSNPSNKDRNTDRSTLLKYFGIRSKYRTNIGLNLSLDRVRESFKELCTCGIPRVMLSKNCKLLIDAYSGGYRFTKYKDGSHSDKPIEDHRYEDIADAHRYLLENFFYISKFEGKSDVVTNYRHEQPWEWMHKGVQNYPNVDYLLNN